MSKIKAFSVFSSDIAILYASLILTLFIRYGQTNFKSYLSAHLEPFSLIFIIWLIIFYISDLYKEKFIKYSLEAFQKFWLSILLSSVISMVIFYIFGPFFQLTPKTNLLLFSAIFGFLDYFWRLILSQLFISKGLRKKLMIIGDSQDISLIIDYLQNNPQAGYELSSWIKNGLNENELKNITDSIIKNKISALIISSSIKRNTSAAKMIYKLLPLEIQIFDVADFFEIIFQKLPIKELSEDWFIEEITMSRRAYDLIKRLLDFILSTLLIITLSPLILIIALFIKITSPGKIIYQQERIGKNDKPFILYKFRTMKNNHSGPLWTTENDSRLTAVGKILRYSHLDELPQLFNVIIGDISFIGPRPERSELVSLYKNLPHYEIRHMIKPGITGWAQLNYKPSASIKEAFEKLQYDIYYIKNRSFFLDFLIILKTIKYVFISHQK